MGLVSFFFQNINSSSPCHGSMFDVDGQVLHGPAVKNLTPKHAKLWKFILGYSVDQYGTKKGLFKLIGLLFHSQFFKIALVFTICKNIFSQTQQLLIEYLNIDISI